MNGHEAVLKAGAACIWRKTAPKMVAGLVIILVEWSGIPDILEVPAVWRHGQFEFKLWDIEHRRDVREVIAWKFRTNPQN